MLCYCFKKGISLQRLAGYNLKSRKLSGSTLCRQMKGNAMKRHEFRDRFSDASLEQQEKSGYVHNSGSKLSTSGPRASLTEKITSGITLKDPSPFGP